ncbi:MAG: cytochrome c-type biogenesis protein CcmH [Acidimicrobiales bacterium]|nr:cytochrome c-type biogenesis protein CcmH [Acidimicrobiales bacterium]
MTPVRRWLPWIAVAVVVAAALGVGVVGERGPSSLQDRADALAAEVRCPTCRSESALESAAASARALRAEIARRLEAGEGDGEIRAYLVSRYGQEILLTPEATGLSSLVWILPVAGLVGALVGLGFVFRRWRATGDGVATDEDRELVAAARRGEPDHTGAAGAEVES